MNEHESDRIKVLDIPREKRLALYALDRAFERHQCKNVNRCQVCRFYLDMREAVNPWP